MEKDEAKRRLLGLRIDADKLSKKTTTSYSEVQRLADELVEIAEGVWGPDSNETKEVRIPLLSPEQLNRQADRLREVPIIHKKDNVTQILRAPVVPHRDYYRKKILQIDEAISAMLHRL